MGTNECVRDADGAGTTTKDDSLEMAHFQKYLSQLHQLESIHILNILSAVTVALLLLVKLRSNLHINENLGSLKQRYQKKKNYQRRLRARERESHLEPANQQQSPPNLYSGTTAENCLEEKVTPFSCQRYALSQRFPCANAAELSAIQFSVFFSTCAPEVFRSLQWYHTSVKLFSDKTFILTRIRIFGPKQAVCRFCAEARTFMKTQQKMLCLSSTPSREIMFMSEAIAKGSAIIATALLELDETISYHRDVFGGSPLLHDDIAVEIAYSFSNIGRLLLEMKHRNRNRESAEYLLRAKYFLSKQFSMYLWSAAQIVLNISRICSVQHEPSDSSSKCALSDAASLVEDVRLLCRNMNAGDSHIVIQVTLQEATTTTTKDSWQSHNILAHTNMQAILDRFQACCESITQLKKKRSFVEEDTLFGQQECLFQSRLWSCHGILLCLLENQLGLLQVWCPMQELGDLPLIDDALNKVSRMVS